MDERQYQSSYATSQNVSILLFRVDLYVAGDVIAQILKPSKMTISL